MDKVQRDVYKRQAVERLPETKRIQMPSEREVYVETKMGSPALCDYVYAAGNFIL